MTIFNEKRFLAFMPRPKILSCFRDRFLVNFHNNLKLNARFARFKKPEQFSKRNEILLLTKRNETKFRCFCCFAKQAKFRETTFLFRFVSCFAKQKKGCEMETLFIL
jgi:hypothetical protein